MSCAFTVDDVRARHRRTLVSLGRYRRLSDFVTSSLLFLRGNSLLRGVLAKEDLRQAPLGDWLGTPAMGVLYAHLNRLHRDHPEDMVFVTSAPMASFVHLANLWLEGGTAARYGAGGGGLSHLSENVDEALSTFAEFVRDEPTAEDALARSLLGVEKISGTVVCAMDVDRGSTRYLDGAAHLMRTSGGRMIPILLQQGRLGATPGYGSMEEDELKAALSAYNVQVVDVGLQFEARMYTTLEWAWHLVHDEAEEQPLIVVKIPRALTVPSAVLPALSDNVDEFLDKARTKAAFFEALRGWLDGYQADELVEIDGCPDKDIVGLCASPGQRIACTRSGM